MPQAQMDWRFNTIWFDQLDQDKFFQKDFKNNTISTENKYFENAEYAIMWHLKEKLNSFDNIVKHEKLLYLELNSASIKDFGGIEKFKNLKRLELHYCVKLENDVGLSQLDNSLEFLHIDRSKKFIFTEELLQVEKLKVLRLNDCGPIDNLEFLKNFPNLIDFRFVGTTILDGNLNPIIEHPAIRTVSFSNKKHYNSREEKIKSELENKYQKDYKTVVHKGQFLTYRYDYD
jgi:hypothetical protein